MRSLNSVYLDRLRLTAEDASTLQALGAFQGRQDLFKKQTPQILRGLREAAVVESAESSNRIEGITAPIERIEALVLKNTQPKDRSEQEIAGYRDALNLVHESAKDMTFSVNVILQLHTFLYRYHPGNGGRWKMTQNEIIEKRPDGTVVRVRFKPPSPVETPMMMDELGLTYLSAVAAAREPLIIIPLAILDFLCIHPFGDGNGRVSRLLSLMLLYQADYEVGRYISLERIIEESKESYYDALEASSRDWHQGKHDSLPWLRYFWGVTIRAYKEFEERVGTLRTGRGAKTDVVEQAIARRLGPFSISDIEADSPGVTRDWIRMVLRRMKDAGTITPQGRGRGAKWIHVKK